MNRKLELQLKDGTLFINDDITIEFSEASVRLDSELNKYTIEDIVPANTQRAKTETVLNTELLNPVKPKETVVINKTVQGSKGASKKHKVTARLYNTDRAKCEAEILNFMAGKLFVRTTDLENLLESKKLQFNSKLVTNILTKLKQSNTIMVVSRGAYSLNETKSANFPGTTTAEIPSIPVEKSPYRDSTNQTIDKNSVGCIFQDLATDDDNIHFPDGYDECEVTVTGWDDGSSLIKAITSDGTKLMIYPHWLVLNALAI